jgi:hypothetical protein
MRFIKFNYNNNTSFSFCLDDLTIFESNEFGTKVVIRNHGEAILPIDTDDLAAAMFSDLHEEREYQLIEIDEPESDEPITVATSRIA